MGNGVTNILLIEGTKVAQQKTRLYVDRWKNEEGKHKIECSLNKYPLNLMNQPPLAHESPLQEIFPSLNRK
jgi:hypothetical protein